MIVSARGMVLSLSAMTKYFELLLAKTKESEVFTFTKILYLDYRGSIVQSKTEVFGDKDEVLKYIVRK